MQEYIDWVLFTDKVGGASLLDYTWDYVKYMTLYANALMEFFCKLHCMYATSVPYNFEVHMWVDVKQNFSRCGDPIATKSGLLQQNAVKCLLQSVNQKMLGTD